MGAVSTQKAVKELTSADIQKLTQIASSLNCTDAVSWLNESSRCLNRAKTLYTQGKIEESLPQLSTAALLFNNAMQLTFISGLRQLEPTILDSSARTEIDGLLNESKKLIYSSIASFRNLDPISAASYLSAAANKFAEARNLYQAQFKKQFDEAKARMRMDIVELRRQVISAGIKSPSILGELNQVGMDLGYANTPAKFNKVMEEFNRARDRIATSLRLSTCAVSFMQLTRGFFSVAPSIDITKANQAGESLSIAFQNFEAANRAALNGDNKKARELMKVAIRQFVGGIQWFNKHASDRLYDLCVPYIEAMQFTTRKDTQTIAEQHFFRSVGEILYLSIGNYGGKTDELIDSNYTVGKAFYAALKSNQLKDLRVAYQEDARHNHVETSANYYVIWARDFPRNLASGLSMPAMIGSFVPPIGPLAIITVTSRGVLAATALLSLESNIADGHVLTLDNLSNIALLGALQRAKGVVAMGTRITGGTYLFGSMAVNTYEDLCRKGQFTVNTALNIGFMIHGTAGMAGIGMDAMKITLEGRQVDVVRFTLPGGRVYYWAPGKRMIEQKVSETRPARQGNISSPRITPSGEVETSDLVGTDRIKVELRKNNPRNVNVEKVSGEYVRLVKLLTDIIRRQCGTNVTSTQFINEVWNIIYRGLKIEYGRNQYDHMWESVLTHNFDCDNISYLIFDAAQQLGLKDIKIVFLKEHALIKFGNRYFEATATKSLVVFTHEQLVERYGKVLLETSDRNEIMSNSLAMTHRIYSPRQKSEIIEDCTEAIRLNRNNTLAWTNRAQTYLELREYKKALYDADQAIKIGTDSPTAYSTRGFALLNLGRYEEAVMDFSKAIDLALDHGISPSYYFYYRSSANYRLRRYSEAIKDANLAIGLNPRLSYAYSLRAVVYAQTKQFPAALRDCEKAIALDRGNYAAFQARGQTYLVNGDYLKAVQNCTIAIKLNPRFADAYRTRAESYQKMGNMVNYNEDMSMYERLKKQFGEFIYFGKVK